MRDRERDGRLGRTVGGRYRVDAVLGTGGTSTVYAATNREGGRVALKVLHRHLALEKTIIEQFLAESYLVSAVGHPGVVRVEGDGVTEDGCPFLVLELLVGQTLEDLRQARGGRIPIDEIIPLADAVMDALESVHAARIVHRDLKPQNVFVLEGGGIKLLDFGVAKVRGHTIDAPQNVVGTPSYMPPEQALGLPKKMDAQSDVWALGATLFHCMSGQPVHAAKNMSAMVLATASSRARSLADAAPELPTELVAVVDRALRYKKKERWDDVHAMRAAWQAAHPAWVPTLMPPKFDADPAFLDASLLQPVAPTHDGTGREKKAGLFDPRDLALEHALGTSAGTEPSLADHRSLDPARASTIPEAPPSKSRFGTAIAAAIVAVVVLVTSAAVGLVACDGPSTSSSKAAFRSSP